VATYCSTKRSEFVNAINRDVMIRYDDPGFVLSSREEIAASDVLPMVPCWTKDDVLRFDASLAETKTIIVSFWEAMDGDYMVIADRILVRVDSRSLGKSLCRPQDGPYFERSRFVRLEVSQKLELVRRSLDCIVGRSSAENLFLLSAPTRRCGSDLWLRTQYNAMASDYCTEYTAFEFISLDAVIPESEIINVQHFTRKGYFALASDLIRRMRTPMARNSKRLLETCVEAGFEDILKNSTTLRLVGGVLSPISAPPECVSAGTEGARH
jgi:hypothetical protein